jgi:hypothetical protein
MAIVGAAGPLRIGTIAELGCLNLAGRELGTRSTETEPAGEQGFAQRRSPATPNPAPAVRTTRARPGRNVAAAASRLSVLSRIANEYRECAANAV